MRKLDHKKQPLNHLNIHLPPKLGMVRYSKIPINQKINNNNNNEYAFKGETKGNT